MPDGKARIYPKIGQGKGVKWGLPDDKAVPVVPEFAELPDIEITPKVAAPAVADTDRVQVEEFLDSIPVLKKASQPVLVPTLREISNEIRKTKSISIAWKNSETLFVK